MNMEAAAIRTYSASHLGLSARDRRAARTADWTAFVDRLRRMAVTGLSRMFNRKEQMFVFRVRPTARGLVQEGLSPRYTAITLLGMADLPEADVRQIIGTATRHAVLARLTADVLTSNNLGDVALSLWAATLYDSGNLRPLAARLEALQPDVREHPVVELAWTLSALCEAESVTSRDFRDRVANRLLLTYNATSRLFPHLAGAHPRHVTCFADLIYPIQALAKYAQATRSQCALDVASECARHLCSLQGDAGQWWWHYDTRTGHVLERYPVYAIHQDAMGPMGLMTLQEAGGPDCTREIRRGLAWLSAAPEIGGGSLVDANAGLVWRKVARREPRKVVRYLQAAASRVHPSLRVPAVDWLFPANTIDYEDRPYHLGWLLYAWREGRGSTVAGTGR